MVAGRTRGRAAAPCMVATGFIGALFRRIVRTGLLGLPLMAAACGNSETGPTTLSVTCDGRLALSGAASIAVTSPGGTGAVLSFPDPVNAGQTGSLPVPAGQSCTIAPTVNAPAKSGGS